MREDRWALSKRVLGARRVSRQIVCGIPLATAVKCKVRLGPGKAAGSSAKIQTEDSQPREDVQF